VPATAGLSGKTPALLIEALQAVPALSASMVARACSCDKATARRNLNRFAKLGLIREITGQGRYKVWVVD
jgi:DNA-binding IclR family transcriptional regulator